VINTRPARAGDADFILGLVPRFVGFDLPAWRNRTEIARLFADELRAALDDGAEMVIAEDERGEPLGFVHVHPQPDLSGCDRAHIGDIAVAEHAEGRGVARALITQAEYWAQQRGYGLLGLTAIAGNEHAREIYEHIGFVEDTVTLVKPVSDRCE
jgi:GNAT superfamily N-acetyltransferase